MADPGHHLLEQLMGMVGTEIGMAHAAVMVLAVALPGEGGISHLVSGVDGSHHHQAEEGHLAVVAMDVARLAAGYLGHHLAGPVGAPLGVELEHVAAQDSGAEAGAQLDGGAVQHVGAHLQPSAPHVAAVPAAAGAGAPAAAEAGAHQAEAAVALAAAAQVAAVAGAAAAGALPHPGAEDRIGSRLLALQLLHPLFMVFHTEQQRMLAD